MKIVDLQKRMQMQMLLNMQIAVNYAAPLCEPEDFSKLLGPEFDLDN